MPLLKGRVHTITPENTPPLLLKRTLLSPEHFFRGPGFCDNEKYFFRYRKSPGPGRNIPVSTIFFSETEAGYFPWLHTEKISYECLLPHFLHDQQFFYSF